MLKDSTTQPSALLKIKDIPLVEELSDDAAFAVKGGQQGQLKKGPVDYHLQCKQINKFEGKPLKQPLWSCLSEVEDPSGQVSITPSSSCRVISIASTRSSKTCNLRPCYRENYQLVYKQKLRMIMKTSSNSPAPQRHRTLLSFGCARLFSKSEKCCKYDRLPGKGFEVAGGRCTYLDTRSTSCRDGQPDTPS